LKEAEMNLNSPMRSAVAFVLAAAAVVGCGGGGSNDTTSAPAGAAAPAVAQDKAAQESSALRVDAVQAEVTPASPRLAVISYWDPKEFSKLPGGGIALINPNSGILEAADDQVERFRASAADAARRGVKLIAYVRLAYGERTPEKPSAGGTPGRTLARVKTEIDAYIKAYGSSIVGVFFDEASYSCEQTAVEYAELGQYVRGKGLPLVVWNPGWVGTDWCYIKNAKSGDIVATFENTLQSYLNDPYVPNDLKNALPIARERGVLQWHLIHTAKTSQDLTTALQTATARGADYVFVTDIGGNWQAGENTWGSPPVYWAQEVAALNGSAAAGLAVNGKYSLRTVTPGFDNRYLRHQNNLGFTEVVTSGSADLLKLDATWAVVPGLADANCFSFAAVNQPGKYLRHYLFRLRTDPSNNSDLFNQDATFCARPGLDGGNGTVSLESKNYPGRFIRHRNAELWLDANNNSTLLRQDASWMPTAPF
jgi:Alpha-L-arabinofuranosidase B (ABFB) domain/Spherulation-specific family 4